MLFTASMMYQYFVKIVPTIYVKGDGEVREQGYEEIKGLKTEHTFWYINVKRLAMTIYINK